MCEHEAQSFRIAGALWIVDPLLELSRSFPNVAIEKEQPWLKFDFVEAPLRVKQRSGGIDV